VKVCVPKREDGLELKSLEIWDQAAMLIHIWSLFAQSGSLWFAWIKANRLKGKSFWQVSICPSCAWSWKKLLKLREVAKSFIRFKVRDGSWIFLWYDHRYLAGRLIEKFGFRALDDAGSNVGAKVSERKHKVKIK
jgi:hypothetical protein